MRVADEVVAVIPAAGAGSRLGGIPGSKEVIALDPAADPSSTPAGRLLGQLGRAGIERAIVVVRSGKWDVIEALGTGRNHGIDIVYRVVGPTPSVPATLAEARPFVGDAATLVAFPDILYAPTAAFAETVAAFRSATAPVVLSLFPTDRPDKSDMAEVDPDGRLRRLWIKADRRDLRYSWGFAVWSPEFYDRLVARAASPGDSELWLGEVFQEAVDDGVEVATVPFPDGLFLDVGTPDDLRRARELVAGRGIAPLDDPRDQST